jgi:DNA-binding LytR/AlgR family response regulator
MKYPYVIIDNDVKSIDKIKESFHNYPEYYCVGIAGNQEDALSVIIDKSPKLVFLEVEIPDDYGNKSTFSVINELKNYVEELPEFIIVTKSNKYAIDAIRHYLIDYLLKTIDGSYFKKAVLRINKKTSDSPETICFKSYGDYRYLDLTEVTHLKADNNTTDFYMANGKKIEAYKTLKHFEGILPEHFVRIHNSYIINTKYVSRIHFGKSKFSVKDTTDSIPFSKSYKNNVEWIKNSLSKQNLLYV